MDAFLVLYIIFRKFIDFIINIKYFVKILYFSCRSTAILLPNNPPLASAIFYVTYFDAVLNVSAPALVAVSWRFLTYLFSKFLKNYQKPWLARYIFVLYSIKYRSSRPEVFCKKGATLLKKKESLTQVFSCEFCEISKNTFSYRTPPVAASVNIFL